MNARENKQSRADVLYVAFLQMPPRRVMEIVVVTFVLRPQFSLLANRAFKRIESHSELRG
jgi:hypothetical protein